MRYLVEGRRQRVLASRKVNASVDDAQLTSLEPDQTVPIRMGHTGLFEAQASFEHAQPQAAAAGLSNSMPKPKALCRPMPRANKAAKASPSRTCKTPVNTASGP